MSAPSSQRDSATSSLFPQGLLFCALASTAIYYFFFVVPYPLLTYFATPLLDLGKLTQHSEVGALEFMAANAALFAVYALAVVLTRSANNRAARWIAFGAPFVFVLVLVFAYPIGAIDVYDYTFHSKMLVYYHVSPTAHVPSEFASDPLIAFIAWKHATSPYGPVWVYLSAALYLLAGGQLLWTLIGFKLLAALGLIACAALVYIIVRRERPRAALSAFVLVAWNPLLLGEMAMNGHNDVLMMMGVLGALAFYQRKQYDWSVLALLTGALIKAPALVLAPVLGLAILRALPDWRERTRFVVSTSASGLMLLLAAYLPLWSGENPLANLIAHEDLFTTSPAAVAWHVLMLRMDADTAKAVVRLAALIIFCVAYVRLLWKLDGSFPSLARSAFRTMLLLLVVVTFWLPLIHL